MKETRRLNEEHQKEDKNKNDQPENINEESVNESMEDDEAKGDSEDDAVDGANVSYDMNMFESFLAYFYQDSESMNFDRTFAQTMFETQDGVCLETPDEIRASPSQLTHIFVANNEFDHDKLKQTISSFGIENLKNVKILRYQWIIDCDAKKKRISEKNYKINL